MTDNEYLDLSDVVETFDLEETRRLLNGQLASLHDEVGEGLIDNFKLLYQRYTSISNSTAMQDPDVIEEVSQAFLDICETFIQLIGQEFGFDVDEIYLENHEKDLPAIALQFYLFFVLDLKSNLYNVLLTYISKNVDMLATEFESLRQRKDSISEINRKMDDQNRALVASNIYEVVNWVMDNLDEDAFFENMEPDYIALKPVKTMFDDGIMTGAFVPQLRDIMKENLAMKARICFDIICQLKGYQMT